MTNALFSPEIQMMLGLLAVFYFSVSFFSITFGLVLMAIAMLFSPEISIGSIGSRAIILRIEDILIPVLALATVAKSAITRKNRLLVASPLNKPVLLLIVLSVISTLRGAMEGWVAILPAMFYIFKTMEFFGIFYLVLNYVRSEKQLKVLLFFVLLTATLTGLYTLKQVPSVYIFSSRRISAPFEGDIPEPETIGGYLAFLILIIFSIFLYEKRTSFKWSYSILILLLFVPFLYTLNRTSYAALIFGLIFVALVEKRNWLRFLVVFLLLLSPLWAPSSVKDRIAWTWLDAKNPGRSLGVDASFQERIYAWKKMWPTFKKSPLIGWGVTSMSFPDSQYVRTLHEIGIIGLGIWLWIFLRLYKMSRWLFNHLEGGMTKGFILGYMAGVLGLLVHAFGCITFYIVRIMEPFMFISGLTVSLYLIKIKELSEGEA